MRPHGKIIKVPSNKKLLFFLGESALFEKCRRKDSPCELIANGMIEEVDVSIASPEMITAFAIEIWRLEKRLNKIKGAMSEKIGDDSNAVFDQIQRIRDFLAKYEIVIKEHTGESYNDGLSLRALHFEIDENLPKGKMQVTETVQPSIYLRGNVISHGTVVVAKSKES